MPVYVDKAIHPYRGMIMCHMLADTPGELHAMADAIGINRKWFQRDASTPHYDISTQKRNLAITLGAITVDRRETVNIIRRLRETRAFE